MSIYITANILHGLKAFMNMLYADIVMGWMQLYADCLSCVLESLKSEVHLNNVFKKHFLPQNKKAPCLTQTVTSAETV
jgi:hypothetical protein